MSWESILFDLDGTLTDSGPGIMRGAQTALRAFGVEVADWRTLRHFIGPPLVDSFERFFAPEQAQAAVAKFREYYNETGWLENAVYDGIESCLRTLREHGRRLYVATSKPEPMAVRVLEYFKLAQYFEDICGALPAVRETANKEAVVRRALAAAGCENLGSAVLVGDREHDVHGGHAAGIAVIGVLYGYGDREELEQAGADRIAATPEEITELILSHN